MTMQKPKEKNDRMIHIRLSKDVHKRLRIRAAELDTTLQDWVASLVAKEIETKKSISKQ